jgi:26S proteasome regulatory subunit T5
MADAPAPAPEEGKSDLESADIWGEGDEGEKLDDEILAMTNEQLRQRIKLLDNDIRIMRSEESRINHESNTQRERIKDNKEKIKLNKQLPYLVGNIVEVPYTYE